MILLALVFLWHGESAFAQTPPNGNVAVTSDLFPNRHNSAELRARVFAEKVLDPTPKLRLTFSGFGEGLLASRPMPPAPAREAVTSGIVRVMDASVDYRASRVDVLAGFTRIAWGRLDELQPTDVINPLDVSRFFFESRSEARLPVPLVRIRGHLSENASIEGVYVPFFRRSRFDQLDEPTSPFNIESSFVPGDVACLAIGCPSVLPVSIERREPSRTPGNAQGGVRVNATTGRMDWSLSAFRGFEPFGLASIGAPRPGAAVFPIDVIHPRFTMVGGDFETVRGEWGVRGEIAAVVDDNFQASLPSIVKGRSVDAGAGVDRKAGAYRVSATALFHRETYNAPLSPGGSRSRADVSLIVSGDRAFSRERFRVRTFGVYNATEASAFLRGIAIATLRDNLAIEGSGGWFVGDGRDLIGRFADSDFILAKLKCYF